MVEFTSLVWAVPIILFIGVILSFTVNHSRQSVKLNISIACIAFLLSLSVIIERYLTSHLDYGYYFDWFVLDNFYYRIGYELNHTSAYFLVVVTGLNVIINLLNYQYKKMSNNNTYGYINLLCGLLTGIVLADNVLTYYIISFCISVTLYLKLANLYVIGMNHTLRYLSKYIIIGHLLFLCALMLIFYHQPNHAVEFTVIDSSLHMQPDLLDTDKEWIIGLLLVVSTIFTSTALVPFENQLRQDTLSHIVTIFVLTSLRILLPAYMLIRFESLIRIDPLTETIVVILGAALLIYTCYKMIKQTSLCDILLNLSNAMLGMLYLMFGLQAELMLSALVLVYLFVYLLSFLLIVFNKHRIIFNIVNTIMGIILLFPFVICISTSNHYSLTLTSSMSLVNLVTWIGIITYSLIVFHGLKGLSSLERINESLLFKKNIIMFGVMVLIAIVMLTSVSKSWWEEFKAEELLEFTVQINNQMWINILIICIFIILGLVGSVLLPYMVRFKPIESKNESQTKLHNKINIMTSIKLIVVYAVEKVEIIWDFIWEKVMPYLFKKGEQYISLKQPKIIYKIVILWTIAVITTVLLVIIRG